MAENQTENSSAGSQNYVSLAERALLSSIKKAGYPINADRLYREWTPTWTLSEVKLLLLELGNKNLVHVFDSTGSGESYFAVKE
jgi:hypothetical protein